MIETVSALRHFGIHAKDGDLGRVVDVFFDDQTWTARYFVVQTGGWLRKRRVLISPIAISGLDEEARAVTVDLSLEQIAQSPPVETHMPFSRQMELKYRDYFAWPLYWVDTYLEAYDRAMYPRLAAADEAAKAGHRRRTETLLPRQPTGADAHLRSAKKVTGYAVMATDGAAGELEDIVLDSEGWVIRSLVVQVAHQEQRHSVVIRPASVRDLNWATSAIHVAMTRREVRQSARHQPLSPSTSPQG